jgi:hypothetical protein
MLHNFERSATASGPTTKSGGMWQIPPRTSQDLLNIQQLARVIAQDRSALGIAQVRGHSLLSGSTAWGETITPCGDQTGLHYPGTRAVLTRVQETDHTYLDQNPKAGLGAQFDAITIGVVDIESLLAIIPGLDGGGFDTFA